MLLTSSATLSYSFIKQDIINIQNQGFIELDERIRMLLVKSWGDNYVVSYPNAKSWSYTKSPALWRWSSFALFIICNIAIFQYITAVIQFIKAYNLRFVKTFIILRFLFSIISNFWKLCYQYLLCSKVEQWELCGCIIFKVSRQGSCLGLVFKHKFTIAFRVFGRISVGDM